MEGEEFANVINNKDIGNHQYKTVLFAVYSAFSSSQNATKGYLNELKTKSNSKNYEILKKLHRINQEEAEQIYLLDLLNSLVKSTHQTIKTVHPEYLFSKISTIGKGFSFNTPKTYKNSIIGTDEDIFCNCLDAILTCLTKMKKLNINFRKQNSKFVIKIYADKANWVQPDLFDFINAKSDQATQIIGNNLEQLVILYALNKLQSISVMLKLRKLNGKDVLYISLPSVNQLQVF